jgi:hypothetical protein
MVLVPPVEVIARKGRKAGRFSVERVVEGRAVVFHGEVPDLAAVGAGYPIVRFCFQRWRPHRLVAGS